MVQKINLTDEYVCGLVDGKGSFSFCTVPKRDGSKAKLPAFIMIMHERDADLIEAVRDHLKLKNKVYRYKPYSTDGYKRGRTARLLVRDFGSLKNNIVPIFYRGLRGYKKVQFMDWIEKVGSDPAVPESYKLIPRLLKKGFYVKNLKFL